MLRAINRLAIEIASLPAQAEPLAICNAEDSETVSLLAPLPSRNVYKEADNVRAVLARSVPHEELLQAVRVFLLAAHEQLHEVRVVKHLLYAAVCREVGVPAV